MFGLTLTAILGLIIIFLLPRSSSNHASFRHDWFIPYNTFLCAFELHACITKEKKDLPIWLKGLAIMSLIFLFGFALFFIWALAIGKAG